MTAVILAGGKSRRMGRDKLSLPQDAWIYELIYPKRMSFYWKMTRLKVLICNDGIAHTALRAFVRIARGKDRLK